MIRAISTCSHYVCLSDDEVSIDGQVIAFVACSLLFEVFVCAVDHSFSPFTAFLLYAVDPRQHLAEKTVIYEFSNAVQKYIYLLLSTRRQDELNVVSKVYSLNVHHALILL